MKNQLRIRAARWNVLSDKCKGLETTIETLNKQITELKEQIIHQQTKQHRFIENERTTHAPSVIYRFTHRKTVYEP